MTSAEASFEKMHNTSKSFVTEEIERNSPDENMEEDEEDSVNNTSGGNEENNSGDEGDESAEDSADEENPKGNAGWADAMRKVLNTNKRKRKKTIVLSKAKKLNDIKPKPKEEVLPFEIEGENGEVKKETIQKDTKVSDTSEIITQLKKHKKKDSLGIRVKPWEKMDREHERRLKKIATAGVVQLFNAVRQQQKEIEDKLTQAGPLERKREKALKNIDRKAFLDVLMGGTNKLTTSNDDDAPDFKEEDDDEVTADSSNQKDGKVWSVLRDDFSMGAKLKDWNKKDTDDEDSSAPEEMDSD